MFRCKIAAISTLLMLTVSSASGQGMYLDNNESAFGFYGGFMSLGNKQSVAFGGGFSIRGKFDVSVSQSNLDGRTSLTAGLMCWFKDNSPSITSVGLNFGVGKAEGGSLIGLVGISVSTRVIRSTHVIVAPIGTVGLAVTTKQGQSSQAIVEGGLGIAVRTGEKTSLVLEGAFGHSGETYTSVGVGLIIRWVQKDRGELLAER
ncbi:MAG: hypothetical protein KOO62_03405 [candidate division Zixibacteria bacterium]|nr:hypothetical protein [candidate division Zixibacteria bacterium]